MKSPLPVGGVSYRHVIAAVGFAFAACLNPLVFGRWFIAPDVDGVPELGLTLVSLGLGVACIILATGATSRIKTRLAASRLPLFLFVGIELALRLTLFTLMSDDGRDRLIGAELMLRDQYMSHPFLQYSGNPGSKRTNWHGFFDDEFEYEASGTELRIACLGGSTTEAGSPGELQLFLDERAEPGSFDVLNFGVSGWASTHSLINYLLNVLPRPDSVVRVGDHPPIGAVKPCCSLLSIARKW